MKRGRISSAVAGRRFQSADKSAYSIRLSPAPRAQSFIWALILGLTPQALCFRLLRRLEDRKLSHENRLGEFRDGNHAQICQNAMRLVRVIFRKSMENISTMSHRIN